MKNIQVSETTFLRLQTLAEPFVDTPESVIIKALNVLEKKTPGAETQRVIGPPEYPLSSPNTFKNIREIPSMAHTRPMSFSLDGKKVILKKWNALNQFIHVAVAKLVGIDTLLISTKANMKKGKIDGFDFIDDLGCSIQRSDADMTVKQIANLVDTFDMDCVINFEWKNNGKSQFSGQAGKIILNSFSKGL